MVVSCSEIQIHTDLTGNRLFETYLKENKFNPLWVELKGLINSEIHSLSEHFADVVFHFYYVIYVYCVYNFS